MAAVGPGPGAGAAPNPTHGGRGYREGRLQFVQGLGCRTSGPWACMSAMQTVWAAGVDRVFWAESASSQTCPGDGLATNTGPPVLSEAKGVADPQVGLPYKHGVPATWDSSKTWPQFLLKTLHRGCHQTFVPDATSPQGSGAPQAGPRSARRLTGGTRRARVRSGGSVRSVRSLRSGTSWTAKRMRPAGFCPQRPHWKSAITLSWCCWRGVGAGACHPEALDPVGLGHIPLVLLCQVAARCPQLGS